MPRYDKAGVGRKLLKNGTKSSVGLECRRVILFAFYSQLVFDVVLLASVKLHLSY